MATKKKATPKKKAATKKAPVVGAVEKKASVPGKWHHAKMKKPTHGYRRNQLEISPVSAGYATPEDAMKAPMGDVARSEVKVLVFISDPL